MEESAFRKKEEDFAKKESILDGSCKYLQRTGKLSRRVLKESGLLRHCGIKGKTRIVIEFDNDTGEGWHRIVSEDPISIATHEGS